MLDVLKMLGSIECDIDKIITSAARQCVRFLTKRTIKGLCPDCFMIPTFIVSTVMALMGSVLTVAPIATAQASQRAIINDPVVFEAEIASAVRVTRIGEGFSVPWGLAFLDETTLLLTERRGALYLLDFKRGQVKSLSHPLAIYARSQGGLLDIALAPDKLWFYVTFSKKIESEGADKAATALARFHLDAKRTHTQNWQTIIETQSRASGGRHFGSRIAFDNQGHVFISVGDRGHRPNGQDLMTHAGAILRLTLTGEVPADNPFVSTEGALAEIWSYGHRNPQGLYYDRDQAALWSIEHGPRGGDEINLIQKGGNYGWPVVSHGKEYSSPFRVGEATSKPGMIDPVKVYVPSIAPSSLLVYGGDAFPQWQGQLFAGALKLKHINHVRMSGKQAVAEHRYFESLGERVRAVVQSPQGWIVFSTDNGNLYKISPLEQQEGL